MTSQEKDMPMVIPGLRTFRWIRLAELGSSALAHSIAFYRERLRENAAPEETQTLIDSKAVLQTRDTELERDNAGAPANGPASAPAGESGSGWPGVVRYSLENWPRTVRLCMIVVLVGVVLMLAVQLGLRFWL